MINKLNVNGFAKEWVEFRQVRDREEDSLFWVNDYDDILFFENWRHGLNLAYYSVIKSVRFDLVRNELMQDDVEEIPFHYYYMENQYGDKVPTKAIFSEEGKFYHVELTCYNSKDYGLGVCNCTSHDAWSDAYEINKDEVINIITVIKKELV